MRAISTSEAEDILNIIFTNAHLRGFSYYRDCWLIHFEPVSDAVYQGHKLPHEMILRIESQWHIGTTENWDKSVKKLYRADLIEPIEPILAYELTALMWSKDNGYGDDVKNVLCRDGSIKLILKGEREIVIMNKCENMVVAWCISDNTDELESTWSLAWDGVYCFRSPT